MAPLTAGLLLALLGLNIWLATAAMHGSDVGEDKVSRNAQWSPSLSRTSLELPSSKSVMGHDNLLAHPVFFKSRQPYVPPPPTPPPAAKAEPPPPATPTDPGFVLGGIMVDGALKKAYVATKADSQGAWLAEGDMIAGWKVLSIDPDGAKLQQASRAIELYLYPPTR